MRAPSGTESNESKETTAMLDKIENLYYGFVMLVIVVGVLYTIYDLVTGAL